jgi:hypothetical protein
LKDWAGNKFPFYTLPPARDTTDAQENAKGIQAIYRRYDSAVLEGLQPTATLWAENGLVKFDPESIDTREVVLTPAGDGVKKFSSGSNGDTSEEEDVRDSDEEDTGEGSAISSDEEEPQAFSKRKREGQLEMMSRNVKPKKVAFAEEPPKSTKFSKLPSKPVTSTRKVGNAKRGSLTAPSTVDDEAYDFSKFF